MRTERLAFRLSPEEMDEVRAAERRSHLQLGRFVRGAALSHATDVNASSAAQHPTRDDAPKGSEP